MTNLTNEAFKVKDVVVLSLPQISESPLTGFVSDVSNRRFTFVYELEGKLKAVGLVNNDQKCLSTLDKLSEPLRKYWYRLFALKRAGQIVWFKSDGARRYGRIIEISEDQKVAKVEVNGHKILEAEARYFTPVDKETRPTIEVPLSMERWSVKNFKHHPSKSDKREAFEAVVCFNDEPVLRVESAGDHSALQYHAMSDYEEFTMHSHRFLTDLVKWAEENKQDVIAVEFDLLFILWFVWARPTGCSSSTYLNLAIKKQMQSHVQFERGLLHNSSNEIPAPAA